VYWYSSRACPRIGPSLSCWDGLQNGFSLQINRLEFMHTRGVLHRDIQLGNCVLGLPGTMCVALEDLPSPQPSRADGLPLRNEQTIYMIDFGFSKRYIEPFTKRHIPDSKAKRDFIGNYWFSSIGVHCKGKGAPHDAFWTSDTNTFCIVPSRRDDLEAVALMLIHLLTPRGLSWTRNGIPKTDYAHERLKREKEFAHPEDLCAELPEQFEDFLRYCRRLKFQECPDYQHWATEFRELLREEGFSTSAQFIWPPPGSAVGLLS
jgi:casein kinase 1